MGDVLQLSERFWRGEFEPREQFRPTRASEEILPGVHFFHYWANVTALRTKAGLVLVDTGSPAGRERLFAAIRAWDAAPVHTAIFTHGHVDHACGLPPFLREAVERGWARPRIVGHRRVAARFDRYRLANGHNARINARQFSVPAVWPMEYDYPDCPYDEALTLQVADATLHLRHARGETDDATWIHWPARHLLFTGDLFFWTAPNAGNPQKVQRYAADWAAALREMATCDAEVLVPGHGVPVLGRARVRQVLEDTAEWLEALVEGTLARMNAGMPLHQILREVKPPAHLADRPYLQAVYDEPEYIVRNVWRLHGGWWDGIPSHLKPAAPDALGREVAALAGGMEPLLARARALAAAGDLTLASHLIDWATGAAGERADVQTARHEIYRARAEREAALMTRGVFFAEAREAAERAGIDWTPPPSDLVPRPPSH